MLLLYTTNQGIASLWQVPSLVVLQTIALLFLKWILVFPSAFLNSWTRQKWGKGGEWYWSSSIAWSSNISESNQSGRGFAFNPHTDYLNNLLYPQIPFKAQIISEDERLYCCCCLCHLQESSSRPARATKKRKSTVSLFEDSESLKWKYDEKWVTICYQSEFCWAEAAWGDTKIKSFITPVPYLFA